MTNDCDTSDGYLIKQIQFGLIHVSIVLQDGDGPCPLIAIANTLLLRGAIGLPHGQSFVSHTALVRILRDYAMETNKLPSDASTQVRANIQANVDASIRVLCSEKMRRGLLINPSLTNVSSFEFTPEIGVFDLFRIRPLHGWVVGSEDEPALREFFNGRSYNQVLDALAYLQHVYDLSAGSAITRDEDDDDDLFDDDVRSGGMIRRASSGGSRSFGEVGTQEQASLASAWFARNCTQITNVGVNLLEQSVMECEIAILFRNNHFSTMIRHNGKLYTLMSAAAYSECPLYVWHRVAVRGCDYGAFDGNFRPISHSKQFYTVPNYSHRRQLGKNNCNASAARNRVGDEIREMKARREALRKKEEQESKYVLHHHPAQRTRRSLRPSERCNLSTTASSTSTSNGISTNLHQRGRIQHHSLSQQGDTLLWNKQQDEVTTQNHHHHHPDPQDGACALT